MPEPTLIILGLKTVAPTLLKIIPWALKKLPRNDPARRAITITAERYSSRVPNVESALEAWILSEPFRSMVEALENGALTGTDLSHVELFVTTTGLSLGTISLETAGDILGYFYGELNGQFLDGVQGTRTGGVLRVGGVGKGLSCGGHGYFSSGTT